MKGRNDILVITKDLYGGLFSELKPMEMDYVHKTRYYKYFKSNKY